MENTEWSLNLLTMAAEECFEVQDDFSDVTFVVEQRKLYFNKTVLAICSLVFKKMFSSEFKEKTTKEVPLPGKKYADFVTFLEQIHPRYSWKPITDDILERLLVLADEYQVDHVRNKCQQYISTQIDSRCWLPTDTTLFYLLMCEKYYLHDRLEMLLHMAADRKIHKLERSSP